MVNLKAQAQTMVARFGEISLGETPVKWLTESWRNIDGIFDRRFFAAEGMNETPIATRITTLSIADADLSEGDVIKVDEDIECRGERFSIKEIRPDGQGITVLELELL